MHESYAVYEENSMPSSTPEITNINHFRILIVRIKIWSHRCSLVVLQLPGWTKMISINCYFESLNLIKTQTKNKQKIIKIHWHHRLVYLTNYVQDCLPNLTKPCQIIQTMPNAANLTHPHPAPFAQEFDHWFFSA